MKKFAMMQTFGCLEEVMKGFDKFGMMLNKKNIQNETKASVEIQTENHDQDNLLFKIESLEECISQLKKEKWDLEKELHQYISSNHEEYSSLNSNNVLTEEQQKSIIIHHISQIWI